LCTLTFYCTLQLTETGGSRVARAGVPPEADPVPRHPQEQASTQRGHPAVASTRGRTLMIVMKRALHFLQRR
jgi:hypothetical protein